jgi:hypothetical protein
MELPLESLKGKVQLIAYMAKVLVKTSKADPS